ncbi:MAG: alpha/beta hydrolase [Caldilineae bacterium]|nr:alpha/beta hydrolase [Anaerolineae bacterium]MCB9153052.1 alpha/beta hydrolase [Caldilineae bacterium]
MAMQAAPELVIHDGLAIYRLGDGEPLLLFPYPHGSTFRSMAENPLARLLAGLGRQVITFDPPSAFRSTRPMRCDLAEMLDCAAEALQVHRVDPPVDVAGHSMGSLCALGLAVERPQLVRRLVLIGSMSGWPAVFRWSTPHNWSPLHDREWWQCIWLGTRQIVGLGNLAVHKRLDNLIKTASYVDKRYVELWTIEPGDSHRPPPARAQWLKAERQVDYAGRLGEVQAPTLIVVGRYDPQTPPVCSEELAAGIQGSQLLIFEHSGHSPFVEEPARFSQELASFLE